MASSPPLSPLQNPGLAPVYRRIENAEQFNCKLAKSFPRKAKPLEIYLPRKNKTIVMTGSKKPTAFYICDVHNYLVSYDEDGTRLYGRTQDKAPDQGIVLSNGCVVQSHAGPVYNNLVITTLMDGQTQVISLPESEDSKDYKLLEFPKNMICVYRQDRLFMFDPQNPFTTHRQLLVSSTAFHQYQGSLYLWNANKNMWNVISSNDIGVIREIPVDFKVHNCQVPRWISSHQFVMMENEVSKRIGVYCTKDHAFEPFVLNQYENKSFGKCMFMVSSSSSSNPSYVLVAQWPSWEEKSFDVRLTVFHVDGTITKVYENLKWFDNRAVGTAPIYNMIGGFSWPYLQKFIAPTSFLSIDNLETNKPVGFFKCNVPVVTRFLGDLAIVQNPANLNLDIVHLKETHRQDLLFRFGRLFVNSFSEALPFVPETHALCSGLKIIVTPDPAENIKVIEVEPEKKETKPVETKEDKTPPVVVSGDSSCSIM